MSDYRKMLKATSMKSLKKRIDNDDAMVGANSSDYLNLEDGKTLKIRIFPAHPGLEDFYIPMKRYWLSVAGDDGEMRRTTVLDSKVHGGTKFDLVEEYVKWAKKKVGNDAAKLDALVGNGPKSNSLNPSYSWLCYADKISGNEPLKARLWEFKKTVRDALNRLAMSEDPDEVIETDPFTDPDEGLPINVTYNKNPNKKKGENYYEVAFPKKVSARPLTDDEIDYFMNQKPLNEVVPMYGMRDFDKALEGLQNFDEENEIGLFDDDDFLAHVEEIKAQYESDDDDDEPKKKKNAAKVVSKKKSEPEEEEGEEEEKPGKNYREGDEFDEMDRKELKAYISDNELDIVVKKSMTDDDLRDAIRKASRDDEEPEQEEEPEEPEEEEEEEEEKPKSKITLSDIRAKLGKK